MINLCDIEKKQNIKFPEEYKQLYQSDFKEFTGKMELRVNDDIFSIQKFLSASEIKDILEEFFVFWGYDIVPIAEIDFEDYICLYYRNDIINPSVIFWSYELVLENSSEEKTVLYGNIHDFLTNIIKL